MPVIGVGAWSWGDRTGYWGYNGDYGKENCRAAYNAAVTSGLGFIDTAEVYGFGLSEEFCGESVNETSKSRRELCLWPLARGSCTCTTAVRARQRLAFSTT